MADIQPLPILADYDTIIVPPQRGRSMMMCGCGKMMNASDMVVKIVTGDHENASVSIGPVICKTCAQCEVPGCDSEWDIPPLCNIHLETRTRRVCVFCNRPKIDGHSRNCIAFVKNPEEVYV